MRCDACRLTEAPGLPERATGGPHRPASTLIGAMLPGPRDGPATVCHPAWHGRAPPVA
jgi:hypothetical protein